MDNLHECFLSCVDYPGYLAFMEKQVPFTGKLGFEGEDVTVGGVPGCLISRTGYSGELGYGPDNPAVGGKFTPAAQRNTWKTPDNLPAGTYSYFCRVHPFMRGSFRVLKPKRGHR